MGKKNDREPYTPDFIMIPPPAPAPDAPPDALSAAQAALARAASAAEGGNLFRADRESRLAERLDRLGRRAREDVPPPEEEEENDGERFRLELERRINLYRLEQRKQMDELKRKDPAAWQKSYEAALAKAREDGGLKRTEAFWTGDPRLFEEPEGGYPPAKKV